MNEISAGIIGASGYTGSELVRILKGHPAVRIEAVTSETHQGKRISDLFPGLERISDEKLVSSKDVNVNDLDVVFLAIPHRVSMNFVKEIWDTGVRMIDLSGDFRLSSVETYEKWYGAEHVCPELIKEAVFGLPELFRENIRGARFVSNPGCYPTSAIIPLAPLIKEHLVEKKGIVVDSKSGVTGAGAKVTQSTHYPGINENFRAYKIGKHRHTPEIEDALRRFSGEEVNLQFTPHLLPINRGILTTSYCRAVEGLNNDDVVEALRSSYRGEPFVRIRDSSPEVQIVRGSNFIDVYGSFDGRTGTVILVSAIDNLVKGASGQAVQNMNLMMNFRETEGLMTVPLSP